MSISNRLYLYLLLLSFLYLICNLRCNLKTKYVSHQMSNEEIPNQKLPENKKPSALPPIPQLKLS